MLIELPVLRANRARVISQAGFSRLFRAITPDGRADPAGTAGLIQPGQPGRPG
jgi:hypothetical protein